MVTPTLEDFEICNYNYHEKIIIREIRSVSREVIGEYLPSRRPVKPSKLVFKDKN